MGVLGEILDAKRESLPLLRKTRLPTPPPPRALELSRRGGPLQLICEFKRRSPSGGAFSSAFTLAQRVNAYEAAGAHMASILCDEPFFGGSYEDLAAARQACSLPLLCKEFIIDEAQLDAARAYGADAVLLIVRCVSPERLGKLIREAQSRELSALVEVHTRQDSQVAVDQGATWIGVNARDLDTLAMDVDGAARVLKSLPSGCVRAQLSGLKTSEDVQAVSRSGADHALIGETLMRLDDPGPCLQSLVRATQSA